MSVVRASKAYTSLSPKYNRAGASLGLYQFQSGSFVTSLQNSAYPHSHDFTQAGNKTGGNNAYGFSEETTSNFGIHYSPSPTFPVHLAIYFGDAYINGVQIEAVRFVAHANHFSTFEIQGSNDSGKASGFCTAGSWTTILSNTAPCTSEYQVFDFTPTTFDFYKAIRLKITGGELGTGGLASYYWRLGGRTRSAVEIL